MPAERGPVAVAQRGLAVLALLGVAVVAQAQAPSKERLAACAACHGPEGVAPSPAIPSLAGQPRLFIENQLVLMREGLREVPAMQAAVAGLGDEEIVALARHYAALPLKPTPGPLQPEQQHAGAALSRQGGCGSCHLPDYRGQNQVPRLAGQHEAYLLASMKQFRDHPGPGRDTIMAATLRGLSDADLQRLAHYFAQAK
jgi:cytochrome c553